MKYILALLCLLMVSSAQAQGTSSGVIAVGEPVNILAFGADPTGVADSTAAIQAAIDYAATHSPLKTIYCPDGNYHINWPVFLDPPGNLRGADGVNGPAYSNAQTYSVGQTVNSGGIPYISLQNSNLNHTPVSSPRFWRVFKWSSGTTYASGDVVRFNGVPYVSLTNGNLNNNPTSSTANWRPTIVGGGNNNFSFTFTGGNPSLGSGQTNRGCTIHPAFNNGIWIDVGPGQGMVVANLTLQGSVGGYRGQLSGFGIGICIESNGGGVNRAYVQNVEIHNIYTASETGCHGDGLGAETTWVKFLADNCQFGILIARSQNDINRVDDPSIGCTNGINATNGPGVMVNGGNMSTPGLQKGSFPISSTSAITATPPGNSWVYSFSTTLASPDANITGCATNVASCVYNSWMIQTAHFGIIPLSVSAYNSSTHVITFQIPPLWSIYNLSGGWPSIPATPATGYTDIEAEIQAATTVYAAERATIFTGNSFSVRQLHVENPGACTTLFVNTSGFNGDHGSIFEKIRFNYDINGISSGSTAQFLCQQSWPFIDNSQVGAASVTFSENDFSGPGAWNPIIIDQSRAIGCWFQRQGHGLTNPTFRGDGGLPCKFEDVTFFPFGGGPINVVNTQQIMFAQQIPTSGSTPMGFPNLFPDLYTTLQAVAGVAFGNYIPINGNVIYTVNGGNGVAARFAQSEHDNFSWGQNLTTTNITGLSWAYKGQTNVVLASANAFAVIFPGLGITLDNGSGAQHYVVTGVFPFLSLDGGTHQGYFTVRKVPGGFDDPQLLVGTKNVVYTCPGSCPSTVIGQDPFVWKTTTLM